jgi:ArsR family transcriptional regulator, arsenate/arsenite/antimonite-responsive transcriptional repressor / arsenate reductase (thioredoxin)
METKDAVHAFAALAQESRLAVFRALVRASPSGIAAGDLAESLGIPPSTLSFHLQHLTAAGLVRSTRSGRSLAYALREESLRELLWFLGEDCCQGRAALCAAPASRIESMRRDAAAEVARPRVLFVCSRNSARSQMAEAILRAEAADRFEVCSAGIAPHEIDPLTLRVLEEARYDTRALFAKDLARFLGKVPIHYAIVVCEAANNHCPRMVPFALDVLFWPFPDPVAAEGSAAQRLQSFRDVRDEIAERIRSWLADRPWDQLDPARARVSSGSPQ